MKKVFILSNDMNGGGAEKVLLTLLRHMPREKYQIHLGLVYLRGPHLNAIPSDIPLRYLFEEGDIGTTTAIQSDEGLLYKRIAPEDSDLEIAFLEGNATKILSKSTNCHARKLAWIHIDLSLYHYTEGIYGSLEDERYCYCAYDRLVFVSQAARSGFELLFGTMFHAKSVVQYNPIDVSEVLSLSVAFNVSKRRLTLCASGRLVPQKGFNRLFSVVRDLQDSGGVFDLWILGDGPERDSLAAEASDLPLSDSVTFWGFQRNPYPFMRSADIFICSSFVEGLSIVVGEALILSKPIVATDCSGIREALQGGTYGIMVENSEQSLKQGISNAIQNLSRHRPCTVSRSRYAPYDPGIQLPKIEQLWDL